MFPKKYINKILCKNHVTAGARQNNDKNKQLKICDK